MSKSRSRTHSADIDQNQRLINAKKNQIHVVPKNENKILNRNFSNNFLANSNNNYNNPKSINSNIINNNENYISAKGEYSSKRYREHRSSNASNNIKAKISANM